MGLRIHLTEISGAFYTIVPLRAGSWSRRSEFGAPCSISPPTYCSFKIGAPDIVPPRAVGGCSVFQASVDTSESVASSEWLDDVKASGLIMLCLQSALVFGSDRRIPVRSRPVVQVRRNGSLLAVLPCTTKSPRRPEDFFRLAPSRTFWTQSREAGDESCAYYRYEVVADGEVGKKIGTLTQGGRIDLMRWLQQRYSTGPTHGQE